MAHLGVGAMGYCLGVDGGGTQTTSWLADEGGRILARCCAGPSNPLKVGSRGAQQAILQAVTRALRRARLTPTTFDGVCVGLAGVDRSQVHRPLLRWLRKAVRARFHLLTTDAAIALHAAFGHSPGILVISGTGSIACARDKSGKMVRAGGWGIPFDDAGSGYDLGRKAVAAALRDFDGRGPHTYLTKGICQALGLQQITEVVSKRFAAATDCRTLSRRHGGKSQAGRRGPSFVRGSRTGVGRLGLGSAPPDELAAARRFGRLLRRGLPGRRRHPSQLHAPPRAPRPTRPSSTPSPRARRGRSGVSSRSRGTSKSPARVRPLGE